MSIAAAAVNAMLLRPAPRLEHATDAAAKESDGGKETSDGGKKTSDSGDGSAEKKRDRPDNSIENAMCAGSAARSDCAHKVHRVEGTVSSLCPHSRVKSHCQECSWSGPCPHGKTGLSSWGHKGSCWECFRSCVCPHGLQARYCTECGGIPPCPHGRESGPCDQCYTSALPVPRSLECCPRSGAGLVAP